MCFMTSPASQSVILNANFNWFSQDVTQKRIFTEKQVCWVASFPCDGVAEQFSLNIKSLFKITRTRFSIYLWNPFRKKKKTDWPCWNCVRKLTISNLNSAMRCESWIQNVKRWPSRPQCQSQDAILLIPCLHSCLLNRVAERSCKTNIVDFFFIY